MDTIIESHAVVELFRHSGSVCYLRPIDMMNAFKLTRRSFVRVKQSGRIIQCIHIHQSIILTNWSHPPERQSLDYVYSSR